MAAAFESITVDVHAKLNVDKNTAEACLKLVEIFLNDHHDLYVKGKKNEDGTETFTFERRSRYVGTQETNTDPAGS